MKTIIFLALLGLNYSLDAQITRITGYQEIDTDELTGKKIKYNDRLYMYHQTPDSAGYDAVIIEFNSILKLYPEISDDPFIDNGVSLFEALAGNEEYVLVAYLINPENKKEYIGIYCIVNNEQSQMIVSAKDLKELTLSNRRYLKRLKE